MSQVRCGDAVEFLPDLPSESVDLAYMDPPFSTGLVHRGRNRRTGVENEFTDRWRGLDEYLEWLRSMLEPTMEALRSTGALFVHCDWRASHHIRVLLDDVFGAGNFRNEIIWHYRRWTAARSSLQRLHQTIYYYARSDAHMPKILRVDYSPTTNLDQIWQTRGRNDNGITTYATEGNAPRNNGAKKGVPLGDVWEIPPLNPKARERVGYPTQKPLVLLERIIELASRPGDLVLDPCCGSGTTLVAAELLGRRSIGFDISPSAVKVTNARLAAPVRSISRVLNGRQAFERQWGSARCRRTLDLLLAHPVQRNKYLHGYLSPAGLEKLGLPTRWSVPVSLVECAVEELDDWITRLRAIVAQKACDTALLLISPESTDLVERVGTQGKLIVAPWPTAERELVVVQRRVKSWLSAMEGSARVGVVAG